MTDTRSASLFMTLHAALPETGDVWMHLVPAGTFSGADGRGPYVLEAPDEVISRSMAAGKLVLDECHATDLAAPSGLPAPARGWIVEMQARPNGIWGRVELTPTGRQLMTEQAYRGISPNFLSTKASPHRVVQIQRASLTNDPNLSLSSLHQKEGADDMSLSKELMARLGLKPDADGAAVEAAIAKALDQVETHGKTITAIATAAGAKADASGDELVTHLQAVKKIAETAGDATKLAATVVELQSKYDGLATSVALERATAFVDRAIEAGKPIKPLRDHYISRHQKDASGVEKEIGAMQSVHDGRIVPPADPKAADLTNVGDIVAKAQLHQKEHPDKLWADCVLAVSGG